jgi:outer membrane protein assembly factor BamE (lipoprotein component of BamABCDE complex)
MRASRIIGILVVVAIAGCALFLYYSRVWSERFLAPIRVGMTTNEVLNLIGPPPRTNRYGAAESWDYTRSWSRDARVYFDTNGIVSAVETD